MVSRKNFTKIVFKLYYFKQKRFVVVFLAMVQCSMLFSQEGKVVFDTLLVQRDSIKTDTILKKRTLSSGAIDEQITYSATGYIKEDIVNKKVYLVKDAKVAKGDITLDADSIVLNMESGVVYAIGRKDTTAKVIGSPAFKQGAQSFKGSELTYNFKSKKGIIRNVFTEQEGGYLFSETTKHMDDGSLNINMSTYSTCNATPPHFYIGFNRAKVVPDKKIITGPAYLVLEGVPLPLILPFGYFPFQKKMAASGIIFPKITETTQLGYGLRDGGYYFAINDNFDLLVKGDMYTNGTWMLNATANYIKRYKYSGNFALNYAKNVTGHKGLSDYTKNSNYRVDWIYNQDSKANPGSRFSASVNMSSSGFDRSNSYIPEQHVTTTRQSSVSYSKTWDGTPFNFSTSLNQSQNVSNKTVSLNLPKVNFSMSRIYPLKNNNRIGKPKWYEELQFQYSASIDNQISTTDSLLFTKEVFKNMRNGFTHQAPLSLQLRPFKNFTISPQIMYTGVLYTQKYEQIWIPDYFNRDLNTTVPTVVTDTLRGLFYGQSVNPSISAGFSPTIFGMYLFKPGGRLQAIRHIIKPSVGFSYIPVFKRLTTDMYRTVQTDINGKSKEYSIFDGNIFGTPSLSSRSGGFSFSLVNIVEAKVFARDDTTGKPKKVKIIDNFTMNTSYNIFADSLRWAPVSMSYRTTLFENINFAAGSSFSLYGLDKKGNPIGTFYFEQNKKLMRLTNLTMSLDFDLGKLLKSGKSAKKQAQPSAATGNTANYYSDASRPSDKPGAVTAGSLPLDKYGYYKFDVPWSLRAAYTFYLTKQINKSVITQNLSVSGDLTLTRKTRINYTTGYDLTQKQITMTSIGIVRDMHCWEMNVEWIPIGTMKSWSFTIRVKTAVLADLKYERRKDFHDQY